MQKMQQEPRVRFLGWEDPLEKETANQLQSSCLENFMDRGAWRVHLGSFPLPCLSSMNIFDSDSFANLARAEEILILFSNVLAIPPI